MTPVFGAVVIGLGNIGQGYDRDDETKVQTHAQAYARHAGFKLLGGVDPDQDKRNLFTCRFGVGAYATIAEMRAQLAPDVISIATPTSRHRETFEAIIDLRPKAIVCEKPMASRFDDALDMVAMAKEQNTLILVNYVRRFDPAVEALNQRLRAGEFGQIHKGVVWYSKGLLNNASHFIDLLAFWLGNPTGFEILQAGREYPSGDFEPDVVITFGTVPIVFLAGREEEVSLKSIELLTEKGVVRYLNGGEKIEIVPVSRNGIFVGQAVLDRAPEVIESGFLKHYQRHVIEALYQALSRNLPLNSTGESALNTLKLVTQIFAKR